MPLTGGDSFGSITFDVLERQRKTTGYVTLHEIPGSSGMFGGYEDRAGAAPTLLSLTVYLPDYATLEDLESAVGDRDTLSADGSVFTATLLSVDGGTVFDFNQGQTARLEFRCVAS